MKKNQIFLGDFAADLDGDPTDPTGAIRASELLERRAERMDQEKGKYRNLASMAAENYRRAASALRAGDVFVAIAYLDDLGWAGIHHERSSRRRGAAIERSDSKYSSLDEMEKEHAKIRADFAKERPKHRSDSAAAQVVAKRRNYCAKTVLRAIGRK